MTARLPRPGGLQSGDVVRARVLRLLRISPMTGGELRRRFGKRRADNAMRVLLETGLIVRDQGGHYWLTGAGLIADRGPLPAEARP